MLVTWVATILAHSFMGFVDWLTWSCWYSRMATAAYRIVEAHFTLLVYWTVHGILRYYRPFFSHACISTLRPAFMPTILLGIGRIFIGIQGRLEWIIFKSPLLLLKGHQILFTQPWCSPGYTSRLVRLILFSFIGQIVHWHAIWRLMIWDIGVYVCLALAFVRHRSSRT